MGYQSSPTQCTIVGPSLCDSTRYATSCPGGSRAKSSPIGIVTEIGYVPRHLTGITAMPADRVSRFSNRDDCEWEGFGRAVCVLAVAELEYERVPR